MLIDRAGVNGRSNRAVDAVVFDIGGVLLEWDPEHLYRRLIPDAATRRWFLSQVCTPEWNAELDAGRSFDEACDELAGEYPDQAELVHAWKRQAEMIVGEVPGTAEVVVSLGKELVPLYLLTNMPVDVFEERRRRYQVLRQFTGAVVSGAEGILKPSAEIFDRLASRFALDPGRTLFIDDMAANVEGARASGFEVHHFTAAAGLAEDLRTRGFQPVAL